MTTQVFTPQEHYAAQQRALEERLGRNGAGGWLRELRLAALERFRVLGFPTARRGNEPWKYTNVAPIARQMFTSSPETPEIGVAALRRLAPKGKAAWAELVFVNGLFAPALSTLPKATADRAATTLAHASPGSNGAREHLARYAPYEQDGFVALNTAFLFDGAYVKVCGEVETLVHIVNVATDPAQSTASRPLSRLRERAGVRVPSPTAQPAVFPRVLLVAAEGARVSLVESYVSVAEQVYLTNAVTEVAVGDGAHVDHCTLVAEGAEAYHVGTTHVSQRRDSLYRSWSFTTGGALVRNSLNVVLEAPGAECHLNGLYATRGKQHVDNTTSIDHATPHTTSREYYKGILDDESRAVFVGRVLVRPDAQKADAHQINRNLVLSPGAEVDTKPSLEIFADDVKCTHGATAGPLDDDMLFYLMSRGLDAQTARQTLVHGFAGEVIDTVPVPGVRRWVERALGAGGTR